MVSTPERMTREIVDRMLPAVHTASTQAFAHVAETDRDQLIATLTSIRVQLAALASQPPATPKPRRRRTDRSAWEHRYEASDCQPSISSYTTSVSSTATSSVRSP
jgi:hypothetical protein